MCMAYVYLPVLKKHQLNLIFQLFQYARVFSGDSKTLTDKKANNDGAQKERYKKNAESKTYKWYKTTVASILSQWKLQNNRLNDCEKKASVFTLSKSGRVFELINNFWRKYDDSCSRESERMERVFFVQKKGMIKSKSQESSSTNSATGILERKDGSPDAPLALLSPVVGVWLIPCPDGGRDNRES